MRPEDPLAKHFEFPHLAGEAIREAEAISIASSLGRLFQNGDVSPCVIDRDLSHLNLRLKLLVGSHLYIINSHDMSQPYDSFEQDGVTLVSRVVRLSSRPGGPGFDLADIYLVGVLGQDQVSVSAKNCPIGVLVTEPGEVVYFKIEENENRGQVIADRVVLDEDSDRILAQQGQIDTANINVVPLTYEERYMAVNEFEKALKVLA
jgi:hypothetical protein